MKVYLIFLFLFIANDINAQINFGAKGGWNLTTLKINSEEGGSCSSKSSFNAGILASIPFKNGMSFQPEVYYSEQGANYYVYQIGNGQYDIQMINIPLTFKYLTSSRLYVETGPQIGFLVTGTEYLNPYPSKNIKNQFNNADLSWLFGIGYQTKKNFGVDIRYNQGLTNFAKSYQNTIGSNIFKNIVFQIDIFHFFKI